MDPNPEGSSLSQLKALVIHLVSDTLENIKMPFDLEKLLNIVEKATVVSMETCVLEVIDLEKGHGFM